MLHPITSFRELSVQQLNRSVLGMPLNLRMYLGAVLFLQKLLGTSSANKKRLAKTLAYFTHQNIVAFKCFTLTSTVQVTHFLAWRDILFVRV